MLHTYKIIYIYMDTCMFKKNMYIDRGRKICIFVFLCVCHVIWDCMFVSLLLTMRGFADGAGERGRERERERHAYYVCIYIYCMCVCLFYICMYIYISIHTYIYICVCVYVYIYKEQTHRETGKLGQMSRVG